MNDVTFTATALRDYMEWQTMDRKIAARINALIKDIQRSDSLNGIGKPEVSKGTAAA
jgi:Txe/YoeB family toxin of Txe-Axe toxin-antitoxin module